jgi:hypothetical protein
LYKFVNLSDRMVSAGSIPAITADRRIKASPKQLYDALHGRLTDHHRFMLRLYLERYEPG